MDPLRLCIALGPLALYLLLLGAINLLRRPFVVNGARDAAALGVGLSGLMIVGPIELLLPTQLATRFGPHVWLMWLIVFVLYGLGLSLLVLLSRPRIHIYNISPASFRPVLAEVLDSLDAEARWVGNSLVLPNLHVELHVEANAAMNNVSLVAASDEQSYAGWHHLERVLAQRLSPVEARPHVRGVALALAAVVMVGSVTWELSNHAQAIHQAFLDMFRM